MKYGLLGIGQAGLRHFEAFKKIRNLKLIGFTEYDLKKANKFKKLNNIEHFNNINELIKLKPDFIVIALPHFLRIEPILECCKNNINLLIEKPLVLNSNELSSIKNYILKKNITNTISFVHRYRKEVFTSYKLIQNSKIGKIKFISETMISQKNQSLPKWIDIKKFSDGEMRKLRKDFQIIFQDPYASLDPRKKVFDIISQGLRVHEKIDKNSINLKVEEIIQDVGLQKEHLNRYPHEFSGGQRQRIGIARALVLNPKFIIADEPVSALDVTIQAQILNLILELKKKYSLTILFISHDLSVINQIADRVMVMYLGHLVEVANTSKLFSNPQHLYTKSLIETAPQIFRKNKKKTLIKGDIPSPINPPSGCVFRTRCPNPGINCKGGDVEMGLVEIEPGHLVDQCCAKNI